MKKLSVEEKAKRYDEAIVKLRGMMPNWERLSYNGKTFLQDLIHILPELKESEDELTWLKRFIEEEIDCLSFDIRDSEDRVKLKNLQRSISWLEKQGEKETVSKVKIGEKYRCSNSVRYTCFQRGKVYEVKDSFDAAMISLCSDYFVLVDDNVEQKPDKVEPKFKVGDIVKHKTNPYLTYVLKRFTDDGNYEFHAIGKDGTEGETCFAVVKYQDDWELVEQKPAWSGEDELRMENILSVIEGHGYPMEVEWIKSLKDRVRPQPKQEWSKDDEYYRNIIMYCLNGECVGNADKKNAVLWLKSLRPQPQQEWDEEDERKISRIYSIIRQAADTHAFSTTCRLIGDKECIELQDFLKSLRPQNRWKPTEEQLKSLARAGNRCISVDDAKILTKLLEQLKKL